MFGDNSLFVYTERVMSLKRGLVVVVIGLCILVLGGLLYIYFRKTFPVNGDPSNPSQFPTVSWLSVVDGQLVYSLNWQVKESKLAVNLDSAEPMTALEMTPDWYVEQTGIKKLEMDTAKYGSGVYRDPNKRPFRNVAYYQTTIKGERYFLVMQLWKNYDGSLAWVPLILPENKVLKDGKVTEYFATAFPSTYSSYLLAPVVQYKDLNTCIANMGLQRQYCEWLWGGLGRLARYGKSMSKWHDTALVPSTIARYPAAFSWTPLFGETNENNNQ